MNKHEVDQKIKNYLLSCMYFDEYVEYGELEKLPVTLTEKIEACKKIFNSEYGKLTPNDALNIQKWLQGAPSIMLIAHQYNEILELGEKWGHLNQFSSEAKQQAYLDNYYNMLANKLKQLFKGYNLPKVQEKVIGIDTLYCVNIMYETLGGDGVEDFETALFTTLKEGVDGVDVDSFSGNGACSPYVDLKSDSRKAVKLMADRVESFINKHPDLVIK